MELLARVAIISRLNGLRIHFQAQLRLLAGSSGSGAIYWLEASIPHHTGLSECPHDPAAGVAQGKGPIEKSPKPAL